MSIWVQSLPCNEMEKGLGEFSHPISTWKEEEQEVLQYSSTKKLYSILDDIEDDATWWEERIWSKNRNAFPEFVEVPNLDGTSTQKRNCFNQDGFKWAMSMVNSRSVFVDGQLRLVPIADYANHYDTVDPKSTMEAQEIQSGFFGTFGTSKGVQIKTPMDPKNKNKVLVKADSEIFVSYGPKTPMDYLLDHGFIPTPMIQTASQSIQKSLSKKSSQNRGLSEVCELTFEITETDDRFYDDKLDILEFESPLGNPKQSFDITSVDDPDPVLLQFLRLAKLEGMDAFLLESIFRKEVWDFMGLPVSEKNEEGIYNDIEAKCKTALKDMMDVSKGQEEDELQLQNTSTTTSSSSSENVCTVIRVLERRALMEMIQVMEREKEALDLKEYYQERRLKDLGLDSEWNEDNENPDVGWGQTRAPGSGDLDW